MKQKNILEQVEEQEKRRERSQKDSEFLKKLFNLLSVVVVITIVVGGIFIYKYFQPTEAELAYKEEQRKAQLLNTVRFDSCETLVQEKLNFPSTYRMKSRDIRYLEEGSYVYISFTAKNAFGADLPQSGECLESKDGMVLIGIKNR